MNQYVLTLHFLSDCLAPIEAAHKARTEHRFDRVECGDSDGPPLAIVWHKAWWYAPMNTGRRKWPFFIGVDLDRIEVGAVAYASRLSMVDNPTGGNSLTTPNRRHEAIPKGEDLELNVILPTDLDLELFEGLLQRVGDFIGFSPHGYRAGFGRFTVVELEPLE